MIEIACDGAPYAGQSIDEAPQSIGLLGAAHHLPFFMVDILAAPGLVPSNCLDVAARVGADPDIAPSRRYHQTTDPLRFPFADGQRLAPHKFPHAPAWQTPDGKGLD